MVLHPVSHSHDAVRKVLCWMRSLHTGVDH